MVLSLDYAIGRFRQLQAEVFRGAGQALRPAEGGTLNPATGVWTPTSPTVLYSGPWLLRIQKWQGVDVVAGGDEVRRHEVSLKLPVDVDIQHNDILVATASQYDSSLVGRWFRVTDTFNDDWQISRRLLVEVVDGVSGPWGDA